MMATTSAPLITSLGLASNLGTDVTVAAAAQRAGLNRRAELLDYLVFDVGPDMEAPVVGAPIIGLTDGFMCPGRWLRMGYAAFGDLIDYGGLPDASDAAFWQRTGLVWALPEITLKRYMWPEAEALTILDQNCARPFLALLGLPIRPENIETVPAGSTATAVIVQGLANRLAQSQLDRVVVLAADSWLDPMSMRMLVDSSRIKSAESPVGLCPGEAAAAIMFETATAARNRAARVEARLAAAAVEGGQWPSGDDSMAARSAASTEIGKSLARAIRRTLADANIQLPFKGDVFVDLNGEEWRTRVWGTAQTMLLDALDPARARLIVPGIEMGDVGAASSAVSACLAMRTFARRYAHGESALVCSLSETGSTGAILFSKE